MTALAADRRQAAAPTRRRPERHQGPVGRADRGPRSARPAMAPARAVPSSTPAASGRACAVDLRVRRPRVTIAEPPVVVTRLTERGLAVIMGLVVLVVLLGVGCVGVTAARVMAEPTAGAAVTQR